MELEIWVHDTALHPSEGKGDGTKWNEIQPAPPHKTLPLVFPWLCHTERDRKRSQCVSHLCDTLRSRVIGWFVPSCFLSNTSLACQARESGSSACVPLLFICLLSESPCPPSLSLLIISHSFWFSSLSTSEFISDFPPTSPSLNISSHLLFSVSSLPPSSLSLLLSLYLLLSWVDSVESWWIRLHVTVWHLSESDVVNMVPADSAVEIIHSGGALRHSYTLAQLPSLHSVDSVSA